MNSEVKDISGFDADFPEMERIPNSFVVDFTEVNCNGKKSVRISVNGMQVGDVIDDNSYEEDFYRYHDVFHYTFATMLDWSPCTRALLKRKRKSMSTIDEYEDGARATITEEAISLMIFNEAKRTDFFEQKKVSKELIRIIMQMTEPFEINVKTESDWEQAILLGYELFKKLRTNRGGSIKFMKNQRQATYIDKA